MREWHRRHHDFEWIDHVEMRLVERWKESEMSGDEWRFSVHVVASFKGVTVVEFAARDFNAAMALLPARLLEAGDNGASSEWLARENATCSQPGCTNEPVVRLYPKRLTSSRGEWLDADEHQSARYYRQFCAKHRRRGDCAREDCDDNYKAKGE